MPILFSVFLPFSGEKKKEKAVCTVAHAAITHRVGRRVTVLLSLLMVLIRLLLHGGHKHYQIRRPIVGGMGEILGLSRDDSPVLVCTGYPLMNLVACADACFTLFLHM